MNTNTELMILTLQSGLKALFVNGTPVCATGSEDSKADPEVVADVLAKQLGVEVIHGRTYSGETNPSNWNSVYEDMFWEDRKKAKVMEVYRGELDIEDHFSQVEFQVPANSSQAQKDAAFMSAVAQYGHVDSELIRTFDL